MEEDDPFEVASRSVACDGNAASQPYPRTGNSHEAACDFYQPEPWKRVNPELTELFNNLCSDHKPQGAVKTTGFKFRQRSPQQFGRTNLDSANAVKLLPYAQPKPTAPLISKFWNRGSGLSSVAQRFAASGCLQPPLKGKTVATHYPAAASGLVRPPAFKLDFSGLNGP
eukprot:TRINITY_DN49839_c0_g1_i2.p1 TRINITY_DN49839_c0_g1~~TRINITY_DN49839_c0_g1_i2.p1  ORF type:complete len:169 (+),score=15.17 TRINITY_DN49839_c0_g1_i2:407-913(+)